MKTRYKWLVTLAGIVACQLLALVASVVASSNGFTFANGTISSPSASFGSLTLSELKGVQCLQVDGTGKVVGVAAACVSSSGSPAAGQLPYFSGGLRLGYNPSFNYSNLNGHLAVTAIDLNSGFGGNQLFRCTVAGVLRAGQVTSVQADCGKAVSIGITTP